MKTCRRVAAYSILIGTVFLMAACGGSDDPLPPDATVPAPGPVQPPATPPGMDPAPAPTPGPVARVEIAPAGGLLIGTSESRTVAVRAFDAAGREVPVAAADVELTSSDASKVAAARAANGFEVRAAVAAGAAVVTARVAGVSSTPAVFYSAEPVAEALVIPDSRVRSLPARVDGTTPAGVGARFRTTLTGAVTAIPGGVLVGSGAQPIGGRIVSVTPNVVSPADSDVVFELIPVAQLFRTVDIDLRFAPEQTRQLYRPGPARMQLTNADRVRAMNLGSAPCQLEGSVAALTGELEVKVDPTLTFDTVLQVSSGVVRRARFVADGKLDASGKAVVNLGATANGSITCKLQLGVIPIPITGPLAPLIAPIVPIDGKLELGAQLQVNLFTFSAEIKQSAQGTFGIDYSDSREGQLQGIQTLTISDPELTRNVSFPTEAGLRVKATAFLGLSSGIALGGVLARLEVVELFAGPEFEAKFAGLADAATDTVYTTEYELKAKAGIGPGEHIGKAIERLLGSSKAVDLSLKIERSLAKSPYAASVTTEKSRYAAGEIVRFDVELNPGSVAFPLVGYNVTEVRVYRLRYGPSVTVEQVASAVPTATGQNMFQLQWTAPENLEVEDAGRPAYFAFVVEKPLSMITGIFPFELGAVRARDRGASAALISGSGTSSIAIKADGRVVTWGTNFGDVLGRSNGSNPLPGFVEGMPAGVKAKAVAAGGWYSVALLEDGRAYAWGWSPNVAEAVGFGSTGLPTVDRPQRVLVDPGVRIAQISTNYLHTLMLTSEGTVWGFGPSPHGALGDFSRAGYLRVLGLTRITAVAAGHSHSMALRDDGKVLVWGRDNFGQTSIGADGAVPIEMAGLPKIVAIAAADFASFALDEGGNVWSWGQPELLGRGGSAAPARIPNLSGVRAISAGNYSAYALMPDGTVRAWGDSLYGRVGTGLNGGVVAVPTTMPGLADVVEVTGAEFHGLALTRNGTVYTWGLNEHKALNGTDAPFQSSVPIISGFFR